MEVRDRDTKALGVDHVVIGECDHVIGDIYNDIESNNSPEFIHVPRGPKLEDIPDIQGPSTHGLVEVMRGCGRNCQFCEPNLRIAKYYPKDKVEREIAVNRKIGNPNVWGHSEDIFLYKLEDKRRFMPNHDAVVDRFNAVIPLSFGWLGGGKSRGFDNVDDQVDEARVRVLDRRGRRAVLELHTMPPTLLQLNPVLKGIFAALCGFGSKKILGGIKGWGRR